MISAKTKIKLINWWPPMLGTGIWLTDVTDDFTRFEVQMKLKWFNRNMVGIHYGGSLYSMCDPWYMFILTLNLGKGYVVLDKSAVIDYRKPGKSTLFCTFEIVPERIQEIREEIAKIGKNDYTFLCEVRDASGELICNVEKVVYVRKKNFDWDALKN